MKISIVTTITNPELRQDPWIEAIRNYCQLADEVIVVNGGEQVTFENVIKIGQLDVECDLRFLNARWPENGGWDELPKHYNAGLEAATGDWVILMDIDRLIHEDEWPMVKQKFEEHNDKAVATFNKINVYAGGKYMSKGELCNAINKAKFPNIGYGKNLDTYTDLCVPIILDGGQDKKGVKTGNTIPTELVGRTGVKIWNFDYTFKTKEVAADCYYKMSIMYQRYFGATKWGATPKDSFDKLYKHLKSRVDECQFRLKADDLPSAIREKFNSLKPEQFGYNGWGAYEKI